MQKNPFTGMQRFGSEGILIFSFVKTQKRSARYFLKHAIWYDPAPFPML